MREFREKIEQFSKWNKTVRRNKRVGKVVSMPANAYFIDDNDILTIVREDGDCRYPYGRDGFNFWAYTSGYMHCNEGLFSLFLRANEGQEPKIAFFAGFPKSDGGYAPVSLLPVPIQQKCSTGIQQAERYTIFSKSCVYYITETQEVRFVIRIFPDENRKIYFTIYIQNLEDETKKLFISSFMNPFLSHSLMENGESRWFREVRYIGNDMDRASLGPFLIKVNEDISRTKSVSNIAVIHRALCLEQNSNILSHGETTSRYQYVGGSMSSLHSPNSLSIGRFENPKHACAFSEVGAAGDIIHLEIGKYGEVRHDMMLSYKIHCLDDNEAYELLTKDINKEEIDKKMRELELISKNNAKELSFKVYGKGKHKLKGNIFNPFIEHLKIQVEFCSLIKGYVQLSEGSLIGIRDVFQALEGLILWQPETARKKMLEAFDFIFTDGRCPRQYTLPVNSETPPVMDLRPFIDQGVWVISTVVAYLRITGDRAFLDEICGYYEIVDEKKGLVKKSGLKDSVLEHIFKIMNYLLSNRDFDNTGCIRALYGDWNDALDGLGVSLDPERDYGSGVSVMASLQVYQNLNEMIELLNWIDAGKYKTQIDCYKAGLKELAPNLKKYAIVSNAIGEKRIVHGWGDKRSYIVGGFDDPDHKSRIGLTSNAFWILSGIYDFDTSLKNIILDAFKRLDTKYGFKTFEPYFESNVSGVGRIVKLPPGTAENGAVYIHASAFAVMALFRVGHSEDAWKQLYKLLPFTHEKVSCSPYVMPNSYGFNEEKGVDGESMLDWQTGSSNVVLKTLIRFVAGIEPEFNGIWIQPASFIPFDDFTLRITVKNCELSIIYKNSGKGYRSYYVDGKEKKGVFCNIMQLTRLWLSNDDLLCGQVQIYVED